MNKNIAIGLLVAVIVIGGGYYLLTSKSDVITDVLPNDDTQIPVTVPPKTTPDTTSPLTLGTPIVKTNSNSSVSISTALVNGEVTPRGTSTSYWFEYGEANNLGSKTAAQQIGSGFYVISSPAYIVGLRANTVYYFRLSAVNNFGTENGITYSFKTNNNPAPKAATPTSHTNNATNILRTTASLNGQVNPNGWQTNYWFEYGKDNKLGNTTSIKSITENTLLTSASTISENISGLEPLTKYYFRLNTQNQFGTINGTILNFTTNGPLNPGVPIVTNNSVSNITSSSVRLNGSINPSGVDTTYWFEYSQDSLLGNIIGGGTSVQTISAGTNTLSVKANVNGLNKNTKYFYRLVGRNQYGTVNSSIMSFSIRQ